MLSRKLSDKFGAIADFLTSNKLKVNDDKTHLIVMSTRQKRRHMDTSQVTITTPTAIISPSKVENLLGAHIHQDMHWKEHLMENENSVIKNLNKRLGALKKISSNASFKTRKMIANGLYISKLIYLMPVWMGCEDYLSMALQVNMNKVARWVTKLDIYTPTSVLMQQCGWMPVRQLMAYHSIVLLHKTLRNQKPHYLFRKVTSGEEQYNTRQSAVYKAALVEAGVTEHAAVEKCKLGLGSRSWAWSSVRWYNRLPADIRAEKTLNSFKIRLKDWVAVNVQ